MIQVPAKIKETLERRLQFILLIILFMPEVSESIESLLSNVENKNLYTGILISATFLTYLLVEMSREDNLPKKMGVWLSNLSLVVMFLLVAVVGTVLSYNVNSIPIVLQLGALTALALLPWVMIVMLIIATVGFFESLKDLK
jgi:hypothetical protein